MVFIVEGKNEAPDEATGYGDRTFDDLANPDHHGCALARREPIFNAVSATC